MFFFMSFISHSRRRKRIRKNGEKTRIKKYSSFSFLSFLIEIYLQKVGDGRWRAREKEKERERDRQIDSFHDDA